MEKWVRANYMPCLPLGDNSSRITECEKHIALSRMAACEGSVLLKNNNDVLPLKEGQKVAVFGKAQIDYVKGGGGSGDVTVSYVRNIYEGLKLKKDNVEVFDELSLFYADYVQKQYNDGAENGMLEEAQISDELLAKAKAFTDTAIITINRYSKENEDRRNDGIDMYFVLSESEKAMVEKVCASFAHVIVLLNVGAMIDTAWFADNDKIEAALMLWQGGMEGGLAAADMLVGEANPSGKLVDTCAREFGDYPSSEGFHESEDYVKYTEDVFVGYRYFETVPGKKDCVVYPFGYGLSYTSFEISDMAACDNGKKIFATACVKNTGSYAGKEVVQLYYNPPVGNIPKPAIELCAFAKTPLLEPGENCTLTLSFDIDDMASYDDTGIIEKSAYVMEKGAYKLMLGNSVRNTTCLDYTYELAENKITKKLTQLCAPQNLGKRMIADGSYVDVPDVKVTPKEYPCEYVCEYKELSEDEDPVKLIEVAKGNISLDEFITQMTDEEMIDILSQQPDVAVSNTGGMGNLPRLGIPNVLTVDGPAGVRIHKECSVNTTAFPVATALACTWNTDILEEVGKAGALETKENNLQIWLTPALNIHRSPLCGRNFEYYSEDPLVSGKMAAAMVRGIQSQNIVAVPKHFACNNKETNRFDSDSIVSERALREIYIKGFEICVKQSNPKMIMTSYNIINGVRASENGELLMGILRDEWGYDGMITTDWSNHAEHYEEVKAGNDIRMGHSNQGKLKPAYDKGLISRNEMAICVKRILEMILWLD